MRQCRRRSPTLTSEQHAILLHGLTGGYSDQPTRNIVVANVNNYSAIEQMAFMGLLKFVREVEGFRRYSVTEAGAAEVGLWLPGD